MTPRGDRAVPSMLDLVRLSRRQLFPPGGVDLYRHVALLTELSAGDEVLEVASGTGVALEYWVREYQVQGSGVEADPAAVERAESRVRGEGLADRLQFQQGSPENLPYRDEIFDVVVGEMGMTAGADPERAIHELVRVAKPGGSVVLIQLVWKAPVDRRRQDVLSAHLGARPLMLVQLKRILRSVGVRDLHTEDWSDEETAFRRRVTKPFPDFTELFSLPEKLGILRRAWKRWGWRGLKVAVLRERQVHRLLTRERIIGLDLLLGTKAGRPEKDAGDGTRRRRGRGEGDRAPLPDGGPPGASRGTDEPDTGEEDPDPEEEDEEETTEERESHEDTAGLPLFGDGESDEEGSGER